MSTPDTPLASASEQPTEQSEASFGDLLAEYNKSHAVTAADGTRQLEGTVISVNADAAILDIGYKIEGLLPLASQPATADPIKPGDKFPVSIKGRDAESGYYLLSRLKIVQPTDWSALERAFTEQSTIVGTVTGLVKGGLTVDVGVRAFLPASRSGARDAEELEKLVGQEIVCRILKLDPAEEDVVLDRRAVTEEEARIARDRRYSEVREGDIVSGTVRSLTDYGAFIDLGGVDGLLHVSDIAWTRITNPADVLTAGQQVEAKILKYDLEKRRISLGMKQLLPHPWENVSEKYKLGERVRGSVTRVTDFGAFVELEPGIEGMIHVSEIDPDKRIQHPQDVFRNGQQVKAQVIGIDPEKRQMKLSIKQMIPTGLDEYLAEHSAGDQVSGRLLGVEGRTARVELGEGIVAICPLPAESAEEKPSETKADLSALSAMLQSRWKTATTAKKAVSAPLTAEAPRAGQIRNFRIVRLDRDRKTIELELA